MKRNLGGHNFKDSVVEMFRKKVDGGTGCGLLSSIVINIAVVVAFWEDGGTALFLLELKTGKLKLFVL